MANYNKVKKVQTYAACGSLLRFPELNNIVFRRAKGAGASRPVLTIQSERDAPPPFPIAIPTMKTQE